MKSEKQTETDDTPVLLQCMLGALTEQVQEVTLPTGSDVTILVELRQSVRRRAALWSVSQEAARVHDGDEDSAAALSARSVG